VYNIQIMNENFEVQLRKKSIRIKYSNGITEFEELFLLDPKTQTFMNESEDLALNCKFDFVWLLNDPTLKYTILSINGSNGA